MRKKLLTFFVFAFLLFIFGLTSCDSGSNSNDTNSNTVDPSSNINGNNDSTCTNTSTIDDSTYTNISTIDDSTYTNISTIDDEKDVYFDVTFKDYDDTILHTISVKEGETPSYDKGTPTRKNDDTYSYTFSGWNPAPSKVTADTVYTATYTSQLLPYSVSIDLDGGTSSQTKLQFRTDKFSKNMLPFDVSKKGYAFKGYELNNIKIYDENGNLFNEYQLTSTMSFKAIYEEAVTLSIKYSIYNPKTNELIESFDNKLDSWDISETKTYNYYTYVDLFTNTKDGYTFSGWFIEGELLSPDSNVSYMIFDEDVTIEAIFKYTLYELNVCTNNSDLGQVMIRDGNSQALYNEETLEVYFNDTVTVVAVSKNDIQFLGWYDENNNNVSTKAAYTFNMLSRDYKLEAKWNYFRITYDLDDGINNEDNPPYYTVDTQNITLKVPTKDGYTFIGWESNGSIINEIDTSNLNNVDVKALWTYYTLTTASNNQNAGTITSYNNKKIVMNETVTIEAKTNPGYTFNGWYDEDINVSNQELYTFKMPAQNLSYIAKWTINSHTITLDNQTNNNTITISGIISGNKYDFGTQIKIKAINNSGLLLVWNVNGIIEKIGDEYYFSVPDNDLNIIITTTQNVYNRNGDKIYFGFYPQTKIEDDTLIDELNNIAGELPTETSLKNWNDYNYYISGEIRSYMYYQDLDYDNDGDYDYRGVYFSLYRPSYCGALTSDDNSYQDNNGYVTKKIHWFSYDPIEWNILNESNGKALIVADLILDSQEYCSGLGVAAWEQHTQYTHNGGTGYINNYELSDIRKWLNDQFYNIAFNNLQKVLIEITIVDNSVDSTLDSTNGFVCNNTSDKIFLLSRSEITGYFPETATRIITGTDYAKCQGLLADSDGNSIWYSRSPRWYNAWSFYGVYSNGLVDGQSHGYNCYGVRPTCWIIL